MMLVPKVRNILPRIARNVLWGNRECWGLEAKYDDPCWKEWEEAKLKFYLENQRKGIGRHVNDAGYKIMPDIDLAGKRILEIGPGDIMHHKYWKGIPKRYLIADIHEGMMQQAKDKLDTLGVTYEALTVQRNKPLKIESSSIDIILSFYSLEHLNPLINNITEMRRLLKPGGLLVGAIPAEGGFLWGLGRFLTSRRWLRKHTNIDPDKIICWEHPNFADKIISELDNTFKRNFISTWPFNFAPLIDANLVLKFSYERKP